MTKPEEARVKASPVARRIAAELGVDLSSVKGTGPEGRVTETDVRAAAKSVAAVADRGPAKGEPKAAPSIKAGEGARIQLSGMRKVIAERLVESKGPVPHFYLNIEIDAGPLMAARAELKSAGEGADAAKITVNDFVLKAAVEAAVQSAESECLIRWRRDRAIRGCRISRIAVAIEDGLVTPVIRAAQSKSLREISEAGQGSRASRAQQANEAGRISRRHVHRFKSRRHGHRQFLRDHQSAAGIHSRRWRDHESSGD